MVPRLKLLEKMKALAIPLHSRAGGVATTFLQQRREAKNADDHGWQQEDESESQRPAYSRPRTWKQLRRETNPRRLAPASSSLLLQLLSSSIAPPPAEPGPVVAWWVPCHPELALAVPVAVA